MQGGGVSEDLRKEMEKHNTYS
jgi:predicted TPR repeat methyltransferase